MSISICYSFKIGLKNSDLLSQNVNLKTDKNRIIQLNYRSSAAF